MTPCSGPVYTEYIFQAKHTYLLNIYFPTIERGGRLSLKIFCSSSLRTRNQGHTQEFVAGGGAQHPLGRQNHMETIDFTDPGDRAVSPYPPLHVTQVEFSVLVFIVNDKN